VGGGERGRRVLGEGVEGRERTVLVRVELQREPTSDLPGEMESLVASAGGTVVASLGQKRVAPDARYFVGKGKLEEIVEAASSHEASTVVFDHNLSPGQVARLEDLTDCKVLDRTEVILAIFARAARTREAGLQIELAQLRYALPRMTRMWHHLSRLGAGIGTRGPGETQLEIDRRRARDRIRSLQQELEKVESSRQVRRSRRRGMFSVTLVGYTNAGKSTLMNALCSAGVGTADRLFATLDTVSRRLEVEDGDTVLLSDTVGFIRRLPETLVASFRATLGVVREADLLLVVADRSDPDRQIKLETVLNTLRRIGAAEIPRMLVWNKMDLVPEDEPGTGLGVSAIRGKGLEGLRKAVRRARDDRLSWFEVVLDSSDGRLINWLHTHCLVRDQAGEGGELRMLVGSEMGGDPVRSALEHSGVSWRMDPLSPGEAVVREGNLERKRSSNG
jgi:GTP-binding protein HflX